MALNTQLGRSCIKYLTDPDGHMLHNPVLAPFRILSYSWDAQGSLYNNSYNLIIHSLKRNVGGLPPVPCNFISPFHSRFLS